MSTKSVVTNTFLAFLAAIVLVAVPSAIAADVLMQWWADAAGMPRDVLRGSPLPSAAGVANSMFVVFLLWKAYSRTIPDSPVAAGDHT